MKKVAQLAVGCLAIGFAGAASAISVTASDGTGTDLAGTLLGSGVTITPGTVTYQGPGSASGSFTGGIGSGIGIEEGIILTTGTATDAVGPNVLDDTTTINGSGGNALLDGLIGGTVEDATVLEFDFTTDTGDLFFNFVFASEEYNEFVNTTFNDVFGFFVDGVNIALIPGTSDPVSINNVNGGNPIGTDASNPHLFNNNDLDDGGPFFDIEYDGFTDVFTASATGLGAGAHTMTIAIADVGDSILDSAVFIQAGTFSSTPTPTDPVPEPATVTLLGLGLAGLVAKSRRKA